MPKEHEHYVSVMNDPKKLNSTPINIQQILHQQRVVYNEKIIAEVGAANQKLYESYRTQRENLEKMAAEEHLPYLFSEKASKEERQAALNALQDVIKRTPYLGVVMTNRIFKPKLAELLKSGSQETSIGMKGKYQLKAVALFPILSPVVQQLNKVDKKDRNKEKYIICVQQCIGIRQKIEELSRKMEGYCNDIAKIPADAYQKKEFIDGRKREEFPEVGAEVSRYLKYFAGYEHFFGLLKAIRSETQVLLNDVETTFKLKPIAFPEPSPETGRRHSISSSSPATTLPVTAVAPPLTTWSSRPDIKPTAMPRLSRAELFPVPPPTIIHERRASIATYIPPELYQPGYSGRIKMKENGAVATCAPSRTRTSGSGI